MSPARRRIRRYEFGAPQPLRYGFLVICTLVGGNLLVWWLGTAAFPDLPPLFGAGQTGAALLLAKSVWVLALLLGAIKFAPVFRR